MEGLEGIKANVFYDDGNSISCKTGMVLEKNADFITIIIFDGRKVTIPLARVVRIEEGVTQ